MISIPEIINDCEKLNNDEPSFLLFEYQFKNYELADSIDRIRSIITKGNGGIDLYKSYNECLDDLIPLFKKGGIKIPEIHIELLISNLVAQKTENGYTSVDWNDPNPTYKFISVDTAIKNSGSIIESITYSEQKKLLAGKYNAYEMRKTSDKDVYLAELR